MHLKSWGTEMTHIIMSVKQRPIWEKNKDENNERDHEAIKERVADTENLRTVYVF